MRSHVQHWLESYLRHDVAALMTPSWFMCVGLAGVVTLIAMLVVARRRGIDTGAAASAVLWCYLAAVLAGIAVPMVIGALQRLFATGQFQLRWSGMTSFWGYLAGAAAVVLVCRRDRVPLGRMADAAVIPLGLALVLARIGCFMAGCDYGKVSAAPWAMRFPAGSPAWRDHVHGGLIPADRAASLPVHPTQLYEALLGLAIIALAIVVGRRLRDRPGRVFIAAAATYAIGRIAIETLRGDLGRGIYAGLSSGQIFSLLVLLAIAGWLVTARHRAIAAAAALVVLATVNVREARAQPQDLPRPAGPQPQEPLPQEPPQEPSQDSPPQEPSQQDSPQQDPEEPSLPPPMALRWNERPLFSTGVLVGVATPLNRPSGQVPTLIGPSVSIGYLPGRFGLWLDFDHLTSSEGSHSTLIAMCSFSYRPIRPLMIAARAGVGLTLVNFQDPAFSDVGARNVRLETIVEYALVRHWALWVRPVAIDMVSSADIGGPITTYQFRLGVAYRFGSRRNARPVPVPLPEPPPPPPPTGPTLDPDPIPEQSATR